MDKQVIASIASVMGWIELVAGGIGSFIMARNVGTIYNILIGKYRSDFNWMAAIMTFCVLIFNVVVVALILFAISTVIDEIERLGGLVSSQPRIAGVPDNAKNGSGYSLLAMEDDKEKGAQWICPKCGASNPKNVHQCKQCGQYK